MPYDAGGAFHLGRMSEALRGTIFHGRLHHFVSIDSTQRLALEGAQAGTEAGQVYLADEQTAGRGRGGHSWHSAPGEGLYLTVLVRPLLMAERALLLSLAAGLAAQAAVLEVTGLRIDLRWPNDLVTIRDGKKLGGILTESALERDGGMRHAAIGIGVNLNTTGFPPELRETATSLRIETGRSVSREALAVALLRALARELRDLETSEATLDRFAAASTWVTGKLVHVAEDDGYTGLTSGLTKAGLLKIVCADGSMRMVRHGGVRTLESSF